MGGIEFDQPVTAGTVLVREAIQSQNYQAGVSGWIVESGGNAEFNDLTIRGTFEGTDFILNTSGFFLYSGTPAAGNLVASAAPNTGTDEYGNEYAAGFATYGTDLFDQPIVSQLADGAVNFYQPGSLSDFDPGGVLVTSLNENDSFRLNVGPPFGFAETFESPLIEMYTSSEFYGLLSDIQVYASSLEIYPGSNSDNCHFSVNFVEQGWGRVDFVARQTNTGTTTTAELVAITSSLIAFQPNRAYRITAHGLLQSTVAADRVDIRVRKTNTSGISLLDGGQQYTIPAASVQVLADLSVVVVTNGTPPTDHLVMTIARTAGTGNASVIASATNPAYLMVEDIGAAADFSGARLLT